jgi:peptidoglycan/xylan/chitin deacetylase (PgdA/CDA1 family)
VLLYHTISAETARFATDPAAFADHLDAVVDDGRRARTIAELVDMPPDTGPAVVVTFDDGYADNLEIALPMLEQRGIPATIFVTTSYIDGGAAAPGRMLSPAGLRELHDAGVEVASHGCRHVSFPRLARSDIRNELRSSKAWLEDIIGAQVVSFAYPHGHHDRRCREEAIAAGYRSASIVMNAVGRPEDDPFAIARLTVERHHDRDDVATMLRQPPAGPRVRLRARAGSLRRALGVPGARRHS